MRRRFLFGVMVVLGGAPGCDAIPINLPDPGLSDGGVSDTAQKGGGKDGEGAGGDVPAAPTGPDIGFAPMVDASWVDSGTGPDGVGLPDACIMDGGGGDAICPPPPDDGGLGDVDLVDGGGDGAAPAGDGGGPAPVPDAGLDASHND